MPGRDIGRQVSFGVRGNVLCFGAALGLVHGMAEAAQLGWSAPEGCPDQSGVEARIAASLGQPLDEAADFAFTATIAHPARQPFALALVITEPGTPGASHTRHFTAASCDELTDAAVAAITFALTVQSVAPEPTPSDEVATPPNKQTSDPRTKSPPTSSPTRAQPEQAKGAGAASPPFFVSAELGPILDLGSLPEPSLGATIRAHLGYKMASLRLGGFVLPEQRSSVDGSSDENAGGEFGLAAASLSACVGPNAAGGRVRLCAGLEGGRLTARGAGVDFIGEVNSSWWAPIADLAYELPLGDFGLYAVAGVGAVTPLVRTRFNLREVGLAHQPSSLSWRGWLGVGWLFR